MANKEIIAGISVASDVASLAVVEHGANEIALLHIDEQRQSSKDEFWFVNVLLQSSGLAELRIDQVAIGLDPGTLTVLKCPLDLTLSQPERNEHIHWELSQYVENYRPKEQINDLHVLRTRPQGNTQDVLAVSVRRDTIFGLQENLNRQKLTLGVVDVNHFAANTALLRSHNEVGRTNCAVIGFNGSRVDVSILNSGHMVDYQYWVASDGNVAAFLQDGLQQTSLDTIYLYGTHLGREHQQTVQSLADVPVVVIDPFRRLKTAPNVPLSAQLADRPERFTAAVGIALRKP